MTPFSSRRTLLLLGTLCCTALGLAAPSPGQSPSDGQSPGARAQPELPPVLLQISRNHAVWDELKLSPQQIARLQTALDQVDGDWWRSRNLPAAERMVQVTELTAAAREQLAEVLSQPQQERLWQLERQALGTRMLLLDDVAERLHLAPAVRQRLAEVAIRTDRRAAELQKQVSGGENRQASEQELETLKDDERRGMVQELSRDQQLQIGSLTGERFDFGKIERTLPRAPELVDADGSWLRGDPAARRLSDLRGQVVVVHFYAFQCINCKRNLPHYLAWHRDYADRGLVVIGIQTPETPAERDAAKVSAAVDADKIDYPVLLDSASTNWKNWGTTMWPTVYLIDREGYIRTWWQGELNWEGATGELQMRRQIEALLAQPETSPSPAEP